MIVENGGYYYIGEFRNDLRHGKGILYFYNKELLFVGCDFEGDKFEGTGALVDPEFEYYIGEWKDNLITGKGILYYKDRSKYQGDFFENKIKGYGKIIWEDGEYYIGEWKNGLKHGKGIMY